MKVYVTKYALTRGIFESEVFFTAKPTMVAVKQGIYWHKPDWHLTLNEAIIHAQAMKQRKIESVRKQLAKLESLTW